MSSSFALPKAPKKIAKGRIDRRTAFETTRRKLFGTETTQKPVGISRPTAQKPVHQRRAIVRPTAKAKPKMKVQKPALASMNPDEPPSNDPPQGFEMPPKKPPVRRQPARQPAKKPPVRRQPAKQPTRRPRDQPLPEDEPMKIDSPKPKKRVLQARRSSDYRPVKKKKKSPPKTKSPKKKSPPRSPRRRRRDSPRGGGRGGGRGGVQHSDMKVAPTQQVTVSASQPSSAGLNALLAKVDQLLKNQQEEKRKGQQKKTFNNAKKVYKQYRKDMIDAVKKQNKEIRRKQLGKIRRMPADQRDAARKQLKEQLKKREESIKKRYPPKVNNPAHLRALIRNKTV